MKQQIITVISLIVFPLASFASDIDSVAVDTVTAEYCIAGIRQPVSVVKLSVRNNSSEGIILWLGNSVQDDFKRYFFRPVLSGTGILPAIYELGNTAVCSESPFSTIFLSFYKVLPSRSEFDVFVINDTEEDSVESPVIKYITEYEVDRIAGDWIYDKLQYYESYEDNFLIIRSSDIRDARIRFERERKRQVEEHWLKTQLTGS